MIKIKEKNFSNFYKIFLIKKNMKTYLKLNNNLIIERS